MNFNTDELEVIDEEVMSDIEYEESMNRMKQISERYDEFVYPSTSGNMPLRILDEHRFVQ